MEEYVGLIPAAGKGLRLGLPYPKELYPIIRENRYKPVSQFVVENLTSSGIHHIVFVINETKHQLIGYYGDGSRFNCHFSYVVQENREDSGRSTSPGLAHALNSAYHLIQGKTVCFGMADTMMSPRDIFSRVVGSCQATDDVMMGLFPTDHPEKFGMVELDEGLNVKRIMDKPATTNLTYMWGVMIWRPRFTEHLNSCICDRQIFDFATVMNLAIDNGLSFRGVPLNEGSYVDLGTYEQIMDLEKKHHAW